MAAAPKMTLPMQLVLRSLLAEPSREMYGFEIGAATGLASGTVHPMLAKLENGFGWLESRWEENLDPHLAGRPRRRYYRLTPDGAQRALTALARVRRQQGTSPLARLYPDLAEGAL